jgi:hypothetical protein
MRKHSITNKKLEDLGNGDQTNVEGKVRLIVGGHAPNLTIFECRSICTQPIKHVNILVSMLRSYPNLPT